MAFSAPSTGGDNLAAKDLVGQLLIVRPTEHAQGINTTFGEKDGIRADVAVLTQQDPTSGQYGVVYRDILWLQGKLVGALKRQIGELVLARMTQGTGKPGQNPPYELQDATSDPQAVQFAEAWMNQHPEFVTALAAPATQPAAAPVPAAVPIPAPAAAPAAITAAAPVPQSVPTPAAPATIPAPAPQPMQLDPAILAQLSPEAIAQLQATIAAR